MRGRLNHGGVPILKCPFCGCVESRVIDSRPTDEGERIRRRRECLECGKRTPKFVNCANESCRQQFLRCEDCTRAGLHPTCGSCVSVGM